MLHGRPHHPQTQGKEERFHRTLNAEVVNGNSFRDNPDCQRAFDEWRPRYNHERPHEALGMATPGDRYRSSPRTFPNELPLIEYAPGDQVRKVDVQGFISFKNRSWRISKALRGERVALRPTGADGVFDVHYCAHRIAFIDLREGETEACGLGQRSALPTGSTGPTTTANRPLVMEKCVHHVSEQVSTLSPAQTRLWPA